MTDTASKNELLVFDANKIYTFLMGYMYRGRAPNANSDLIDPNLAVQIPLDSLMFVHRQLKKRKFKFFVKRSSWNAIKSDRAKIGLVFQEAKLGFRPLCPYCAELVILK
jgi:hypothetical protein